MTLKRVKRRNETDHNKKLNRAYDEMEILIDALNLKGIPERESESINAHIEVINEFAGAEKELIKLLKKTRREVLTLINAQLKLVPKHHFRAQWLLYGMLTGTVLTVLINNFGWMRLNGSGSMILPLAVAGGIILGIFLDKRAEQDGLQLNLKAEEY